MTGGRQQQPPDDGPTRLPDSREPRSIVDLGRVSFKPRQRGLVGGVVAGFVALGCCVGPTLAALLGVTSVATAVSVANHLYNEWGWLFKALALATAAVAVILALRSRNACRAPVTGLRVFLFWLAASGVATYSLLYALTPWLGTAAT